MATEWFPGPAIFEAFNRQLEPRVPISLLDSRWQSGLGTPLDCGGNCCRPRNGSGPLLEAQLVSEDRILGIASPQVPVPPRSL